MRRRKAREADELKRLGNSGGRMKKLVFLVFSDLRLRLALLVLFAVVPALALIFYAAEEQRRSSSLEAQQSAQRLARLVSANQEVLIAGTRQLLTAVAEVPVV